jgi:hypothetical protein
MPVIPFPYIEGEVLLGQELLHAEKHGIPVHRVSIEGRTLHAGELGLAIYLHPTGSAHVVPSTINSRVSTSEEHRQIRSGAYQTLKRRLIRMRLQQGRRRSWSGRIMDQMKAYKLPEYDLTRNSHNQKSDNGEWVR